MVVTKSNIMAKRIRKNQGSRPVKVQKSEETFIPTKTQNLAFEVPAKNLEVLVNEIIPPEELKVILKEVKTAIKIEDLGDIDNGILDYHLTGLQFEFDEENGEKIVKVLQVYYVNKVTYENINNEINIDAFIRYQDQSNDGIINLLSSDSKRTIVEHKSLPADNAIPEISHHTFEPGITSAQLNFKNLDFFKDHSGEPVEFVYFTIDQIRPLITHTAKTNGNIVLSGSRLDLGRKLSPDGESLLYEGMYFSLKMEGILGNENPGSNFKTTNGEVTDSPGIAISAPCPPRWYYLNNLLLAARQVNDLAKIPVLKDGKILSISKTISKKSDNKFFD